MSDGPVLPGARTFTVEQGAKTNRVRGASRLRKHDNAANLRKAYRKRNGTFGLPHAPICVCIPIDELEELDGWVRAANMPRSQFIRQAVKHFAAKVGLK